jgi:SHS2 domain-containing protein
VGEFEMLEHAADARVRLRGDSLEDVFATAARSLVQLLIGDSRIERSRSRSLELSADSPTQLLVDWLDELIFLFETEAWLAAEAELDIQPGWRLRAVTRGQPHDTERQPIETVVKAATHHRLRLERRNSGWEAEVVFDL